MQSGYKESISRPSCIQDPVFVGFVGTRIEKMESNQGKDL